MLASMAIGGLLGYLGSGKKPKVPQFRKVDSTAEQGEAIDGNLTNFDKAGELVSKTNDLSQDELLKALRRAIPGYDDMVSKSSELLSSQMAGEVPQDVQDQISRRVAARSLSGGFSGSGMSRNLEMRDLGLTSLQQTQAGLNNAMNFMRNQAGIAVAPQMSVTSMFLSPAQRIAHEVGERNLEFQRNMTAAQIKAMPDPQFAGIMNGVIGGMMGGMGGMMGGMGGMMGGMGGGAGGMMGGMGGGMGGGMMGGGFGALSNLLGQGLTGGLTMGAGNSLFMRQQGNGGEYYAPVFGN